MKTPHQIARETVLDQYGFASDLDPKAALNEVLDARDVYTPNDLLDVIVKAIEADRLQRPSIDALEQALHEWSAAKLLDSGDEEYDAAQEMAESIEEYLNNLEES